MIAHFSPEAWIRDEAIPCDPNGPQEWDCTAFYATLPEEYRAALEADPDMDGDPYGAVDDFDMLLEDPAAPSWVREWPGPCTIRVRRD